VPSAAVLRKKVWWRRRKKGSWPSVLLGGLVLHRVVKARGGAGLVKKGTRFNQS
jgi:hypothetical protein